MKLEIALAVALTFGVISPAFAFCSEPSVSSYLRPPDVPGSYARPSVPYCLSSYRYSREHTCERWELDSYFSDVADYVNSLQTYLDETNEYARKVSRFTEEAETYANCEAEEVNTQHE